MRTATTANQLTITEHKDREISSQETHVILQIVKDELQSQINFFNTDSKFKSSRIQIGNDLNTDEMLSVQIGTVQIK